MNYILTDADKALENCRLYAARHRSEEWAKTILRFCAEAGVTGSPLRALPAQVERCPTCGADEPFTGTCGTHDGDTRALCKRPTVSPTPAAPAAPAGMAVPATPEAIKAFIGSSFTSAKFVRDDGQVGTHNVPADAMDLYTVTAHDLMEAFSQWDWAASPSAQAAPAGMAVPDGWKLVPDFKVGAHVIFEGVEHVIFAMGDRSGTFDIQLPSGSGDRWRNVPPSALRYAPSDPHALAASPSAQAAPEPDTNDQFKCGTCKHKATPLGQDPCRGCRYSGFPNWEAAPARGAMEWISVEDRMPEPGTDCLVWVTSLGVGKGFAKVDCWDEQREAPVSWSSATIPVGLGWNDSDYEDVTHWMPLPPAPGIGTTAPAGGEG